MKFSARFAGGLLAVVAAVVLHVVPAHATVHEIVAQWCSGQEPLEPHGVSREGSKNFAQPLQATGVVRQTMGSDANGPFILVTFDFDHPAVKVQSSGLRIQIGTTPDGTRILLDLIEPDPSFPAFQRCPKLG